MKKLSALLVPFAIAALIAGCGSSSSSSSTKASSAASTATTTSSSSSTASSASTASSTTTAAATTTGAALSEPAWKKQVDAICTSANTQGNKLVKPTGLNQLQGYLQQIVNLGKAEIAQIKAVNPPAAFKAGQQAVIADLTNIYDSLQRILDRHLSQSALSQAFRAYPASIQASSQDYVTRSKAAGLTSCLNGGSA